MTRINSRFPETKWEKGSFKVFTDGKSTIPISKPAQYIYRAVIRYPNATRAIEALRKIGSPPIMVDLSHPSITVQSVCQIMAALASHMKAYRKTTAIQVRAHWVKVLGPWVDFLLRSFIVNHEKPTTVAGMNVFECSVTAISALLDFPDNDGSLIRHASPNLQGLVTQAWYLLVDFEHANWGPWSHALINLAHSNPDAIPPQPIEPDWPVLYKEDADLGKILLRHLARGAQRLRTMPNQELSFFKCYVMLLTTDPQCFQIHNPIYLRVHIRSTITILLDILSILLPLRRKSLMTASIDSQEFKDAHDLVLLSMMTLDRWMHDSVRAQQILESGLVRKVLLADARYFEMDEKHKTAPEGRFAEWSAKVIDHISRYLVYPSVLRQFIRYGRGEDLRPENLVEKGSTSLWKSWRNAISKAAIMYDVRQLSKEDGLCSNLDCPLQTKSPEERLGLRYSRCLGCKSVMYCSLACRKAHWKKEHRNVCNEIEEMRKRGRSAMTIHDLNAFGHLLKSYLQTHADDFDYSIQMYSSSVAPERLEPSIRDGTRHPIVFIDFDLPEIPPIHEAELIQPSSLRGRIQDKYQWESRWTETLLKTWEGTDRRKVLVLTAFARTEFSSWPYAIVIDFPFGEEEDGGVPRPEKEDKEGGI